MCGYEVAAASAQPTQEVPQQQYQPTQEVPQQQYQPTQEIPQQQYQPTQEVPPQQYQPTQEVPPQQYQPTQEVPPQQYQPTQEVPQQQYQPTQEVPPQQYQPTQEVPQQQYQPTQGIPQQQYQQPVQGYQQYAQQQGNAAYPPQAKKPKKKKKWLIPSIISVLIVAIIAVGAIFVWQKIAKNNPESAVETMLDDKKAEIKDALPDVVLNSLPSEMSPYKSQLKKVMSNVTDNLLDTVEYKVVSSEINGDEAKVKVEISVPDFSKMGSLSETQATELGISILSGDFADKIKELLKSCGTVTETVEIEANKKDGKWIAELPKELDFDIKDLNLSDFI
jgi:hypothetical protein